MSLHRTTSEHPGFVALVRHLDAYLAHIDGDEHAFYAQYNKIAALQNVVVALDGNTPIGCGAFKPFDESTVEVKRMYVLPEWRGKGVAPQVLNQLENWAAELGYGRCVLETGLRMPDAVAFYTKNGYARIENFGQYAGVENSVCFEKELQI
ncbi:MAG: GNAT family N-acetyltransferase [Saprospiraceae bacterium]|jgi:GNAT superfamily N-acetyltransferase|nr:GNAT family N-acetyltransferase [Saprospiraceae bacterium]